MAVMFLHKVGAYTGGQEKTALKFYMPK